MTVHSIVHSVVVDVDPSTYSFVYCKLRLYNHSYSADDRSGIDCLGPYRSICSVFWLASITRLQSAEGRHSMHYHYFGGLCPPVLMGVFSILTVRHRRELQTRLKTTRKGSKRDHALMVMLMSEVVSM